MDKILLKSQYSFFYRFPTIPFKLFEKPEIELFAESNFRSFKVNQSYLRKKCPKTMKITEASKSLITILRSFWDLTQVYTLH